MPEHRFRPGKEWGSRARKAEDAPGRKSQERRAAIEDQLDLQPWQAALLERALDAADRGARLTILMPRRRR